MFKSSLVLLFLATTPIILCPSLAGQEAGARDMFFGGLEAVSPAAAARRTAVAKSGAAKVAPGSRRTTAAGPKPVTSTAAVTGVTTAADRSPGPTTGKVPIINAAYTRLGLRYAILKMNGAEATEVPLSTRFHSGDRLQLAIEANNDAYLYIVTQGSSGAWSVMFPAKSRNEGSSRVKAGEEHTTMFRFDAKPGVEKIFVVLSRVPERDLDSVIYSLKGNGAPAAAPSSDPVMLAGNLSVGDPLVSRLRTSYTRDLVLEEVAAAGTAERAMYVVSKSTGQDARVVADIKLVHE